MAREIDLTQQTGPVLSTVDLAQSYNISAETIRREIRYGELRAGALRRPSGRVKYLIPWAEARRWAIRIGLIRVAS